MNINHLINTSINQLPFPLSAAWLLRKASVSVLNMAAVVALHPAAVAVAAHVEGAPPIPPPDFFISAMKSYWHSLGYLRKKESNCVTHA